MISPTAFPSLVDAACDQVEIVGSELRQRLRREITAKVLLRRARDVVLLSGPTGVGKEMVAAACHRAARDGLGRHGDLVEVNCANLTHGLFESELFGHRRGSFTGAERDYAGLVGQASHGTLVLDEIQALEPQDQARLLRFLGEREFRSVGDDRVKSTDALIILATNRDPQQMVREGTFRRDLLDRASAKLTVPSLYERRQDIGELAQAFALEAGRDLDLSEEDFYGLTRRARADVETAVVRAEEVSVRRLREIVRDAVFLAAAEGLGDALDSAAVLPILERELEFREEHRDALDVRELTEEFDLAVSRALLMQLAERHRISKRALSGLIRAVHSLIDEMEDQPRTYRNVVDRTNRLAKVALWLVSGATTQAEFRRFFGELDHQMPTKSVAHQVFYEVFPKDDNDQP